MNKCEKCGKNIDAASKFCPHCGAPQTLAESAATTEVKKETVKSAYFSLTIFAGLFIQVL